jgi:Ca2+-binding RTX toxin-like protein
MATGTNRNDTLSATARNELIYGLGGHDVLTSLFNKNKLFGQGGNDTLTVDLDRASDIDAVTLFSTLSGGIGADKLNLTYRGYSGKYTTMRADVDGGNGNDQINVGVGADGGTTTTVALRIDGGNGRDSINVGVGAFGGTEATTDIRADGGAGNDRITVDNSAAGLGNSETWDDTEETVTTVYGGDGDDIIDVYAYTGSFASNSYATNNVLGGAGNDRITAYAEGEFGGWDPYVTNSIDGGEGDDIIEATANADSNGGYYARNIVYGGGGNDRITATALASSNDASVIAENVVDGGDGNDTVILESYTSYSKDDVRVTGTGGAGNDLITSTTAIGAEYGAKAKIALDGGLGNDHIESTVTSGTPVMSPFGDLIYVKHRIQGGEGNDAMISRLEMPASGEAQVAATSRLDGEAGHDAMTGTIVGQGRTIFHGGSGWDVLKVEGGQNNLLSGGSGKDRLFAGSGTDKLTGGGGEDDFVVDVTRDLGADRILDFESDRDRLCFIGLEDKGANGLADDLAQLSDVVDLGAGDDVVVTFDSGTVLTFEGCGLGTEFYYNSEEDYGQRPLIDSLADLVDNPATQLLIEA